MFLSDQVQASRSFIFLWTMPLKPPFVNTQSYIYDHICMRILPQLIARRGSVCLHVPQKHAHTASIARG